MILIFGAFFLLIWFLLRYKYPEIGKEGKALSEITGTYPGKVLVNGTTFIGFASQRYGSVIKEGQKIIVTRISLGSLDRFLFVKEKK